MRNKKNISNRKQSYFLSSFYIFKKIYLKIFSYILKLKNDNDSVILHTLPFYKIKMWLNLRRDVDRGIYFGTFEFNNAFIFFDLIKQGYVVVDIGANIGLYSLLAAKKLKNTGKVYSFEPSKFVIKELRKNIEVNNFNNINVFELALSNSIGKGELYRCEDDAYNSLIAKPMTKVVSIDSVDIITLDDFVKMNNIEKIDVIKIDAEGLDYLILKGAQWTLKNFRPIIFCEFNSFYLNDKSQRDFITYLEENEYEVFFAKSNKFILRIEKFYINENNKSASEIICFPTIK